MGDAGVANPIGLVIDHDPGGSVEAMGGGEHGARSITTFVRWVGGVPALGPQTLSLGGEQRHGWLGSEGDRDFSAQSDRDRHIPR